MINDAHVHFFASGWRGTAAAPDGDVREYEELRAEHGIDRVLAVGYEGEARYAGNNEHVARLAEGRPWLAPLAYLDLRPQAGRAVTPDTVAAWLGRGFAGLSVYCPDDGAARAADAALASLAGPLTRSAAVVSLNCPAPRIPLLSGALARLAGACVMVSHLGQPGPADAPAPRERLAGLLAAARLPHVGVKLSGAYAAGAGALRYARLLLETFGPHRLYWGSDYAPCLDAGPFADTVTAFAALPLSPAERRLVTHDNLGAALDRVTGPGRTT
ncbi:amidohydrolase family protein [Dactylosporangium salmoneum]|uniref:amidohydrolase family protein n=1 Tax=Dactylosporangium salmoneum TaxID=53361 RepID=UPI0031CF86BA